ncbi:MAG: hypothetical protein WCI65_03045 [Synechococcaceae cyanobacterium ELA263]
MKALFHTIGAVVVLPYVALALFFLFIGELARTKGLFALVDVALFHANWFALWGIYAGAILWICLVATGFVPRLQRASSLCLGLLAAASFIVVFLLSSTRSAGEVIVLLPCVAVAATSAWLFLSAGSRQ